MKNKDDYLQGIEAGIRQELSAVCGCTPDNLPVSLSPEQALKFFQIGNPKTLHVWKSTKRHGLVWIKRGQRFEIGSESAVQHRLQSIVIPPEAISA